MEGHSEERISSTTAEQCQHSDPNGAPWGVAVDLECAGGRTVAHIFLQRYAISFFRMIAVGYI